MRRAGGSGAGPLRCAVASCPARDLPRGTVGRTLIAVTRRAEHQLGLDHRHEPRVGQRSRRASVVNHLLHVAVAFLPLQAEQHLACTGQPAAAEQGQCPALDHGSGRDGRGRDAGGRALLGRVGDHRLGRARPPRRGALDAGFRDSVEPAHTPMPCSSGLGSVHREPAAKILADYKRTSGDLVDNYLNSRPQSLTRQA
jgi:hypothetical protein